MRFVIAQAALGATFGYADRSFHRRHNVGDSDRTRLAREAIATIHATPVFREQGGGSFINIASTAGVRPRPGLTWYNGSKGAVITTSKSLAAELGPDNIRVNCINPVFNPDTGLSAEFAGGPLDEERKARFRASIPLGRFSTALDVANAALYLASDEADFISGVCIEVDGARCV